jgi:hypothetical protein
VKSSLSGLGKKMDFGKEKMSDALNMDGKF